MDIFFFLPLHELYVVGTFIRCLAEDLLTSTCNMFFCFVLFLFCVCVCVCVCRNKYTPLFWRFDMSYHNPLKRQSQLLSSAWSSAGYFKSHFCKQCGPRSDCSFRSSLIWVHTVCLYAKCKFEKFARRCSRWHKQTTFSDAFSWRFKG